MGHVITFLARWQHCRFSPSGTQRRGGAGGAPWWVNAVNYDV